ncbi:MAG: hypothetical protein LBH29_05765 [Elusimicrobiota bacterium]|jgi:hypothetical protein|nr:hypothetical protein [Elusimicrobiota bacterium]
MKKIFLALSFSLFFAGISFAQDFGTDKALHLSGSKSLGLSIVSFNGLAEPDLPAVNFRFWFDDNVAVEAVFGGAGGDNRDIVYVEGKLLAIIKNYNSLNFYASAFGGFGISNYARAESASLLNIGAGIGAEWFVINNLSISYEINLLYSEKGGGDSQIGISADVLPKAGIRIYF